MQRAEVRIVEPQQIQSQPSDVNNSEAQALLAKYGFSKQQPQPQPIHNPTNDLTVDELWNEQQRQLEEERLRKQQQMNSPKPYSFDRNQIGYSESKWASIGEGNFGVQVQIVSNMPINR